MSFPFPFRLALLEIRSDETLPSAGLESNQLANKVRSPVCRGVFGDVLIFLKKKTSHEHKQSYSASTSNMKYKVGGIEIRTLKSLR
jgi:hypothetical protein